MTNKKNKGQSMVEMLFSVAIITIVLGGVVILMLNVVNSRTKGMDRKKATRLAELTIEKLISEKNNDPDTFWTLTPVTNQISPDAEFSGFIYSIGFTNIANNADYPKCGLTSLGVATTNCAETTINIEWQGKVVEQISFSRLFTRNQ